MFLTNKSFQCNPIIGKWFVNGSDLYEPQFPIFRYKNKVKGEITNYK